MMGNIAIIFSTTLFSLAVHTINKTEDRLLSR